MVSIADGVEFPQLQKTIEEVHAIFSDIYWLNAVMSDQFNLNVLHPDREDRAEIVARKLGEEIEKLSGKMCDLSDFEFPRRAGAA